MLLLKKQKKTQKRPNQKELCENVRYVPIKNLEDLYDKEGYRDGEFKKGDKGTWVIRSEMTTELKDENMESKGMVVRLNRNTRTTTGEYFVRIIKKTMRARYIVMNENTQSKLIIKNYSIKINR